MFKDLRQLLPDVQQHKAVMTVVMTTNSKLDYKIVVLNSVFTNEKISNGLSHRGEYNSGNSDPLQHQSLSDTPGRHCSQMRERDLCHPT